LGVGIIYKEVFMRNLKIRPVYLALSMLVAMPGLAHAKETPPTNRISIEKARSAATKAYSGKIQAEELEFEGGKWIYSFDLKTSKDRNVHEVHIDALTGKVLDIHTETASDERKELQEDQSHSDH
jgi:hypothetical protein